jgi:hypothetical protein
VHSVAASTATTRKGQNIVAISGTIPAISHVAVTVTDLSAGEARYTRVFGVGPVLDEDTGPFRHIV